MRIRGSVAFVTGANRGLGLAFVKELLGRGVKKLKNSMPACATEMASIFRTLYQSKFDVLRHHPRLSDAAATGQRPMTVHEFLCAGRFKVASGAA